MGAKIEIYELMKALVATGVAIVLVSSDLPGGSQPLASAHVMHRSRMAAELTGADISEPAVLSHFFREQQAAGVATNALATNDPTTHAQH